MSGDFPIEAKPFGIPSKDTVDRVVDPLTIQPSRAARLYSSGGGGGDAPLGWSPLEGPSHGTEGRGVKFRVEFPQVTGFGPTVAISIAIQAAC